jgi:uncharacterized membrane protein YjdF
MFLTRKDLIGTAVTALVLLAYIGNAQDWLYLGDNRWAAVTMLAIGIVGCPLAVRLVDDDLTSPPIIGLGVLGAIALGLGIAAVVTAAQWALSALAIVVVMLWIGTTLRHATTPAHPHAAR